MSRYTKDLEDGRLVTYGFDNALGYFLDVFSTPDEKGIRKLLIEESSLLTKMSNGKMLELMEDYDLNESHRDKVAMDLAI